MQRVVPELLAPAGGPDPFYAALSAGADAIYCGLGNSFNARRGAHNFTDDQFRAACRAAHLAGARVYVTQNVVIKDEEMERALRLAHHAWELGADALILQDWGLMSEVRRRWPQIEVHVSTQANVHDARGVAWCRDVLGVERVTVSRELSLGELARVAGEGVDIESFGHGALCFCYSGVCMMSSLAGARSANRGLCAQPCRLLYDLVDEKGQVIAAPNRQRPLCPKDYCTIDHLSELAEAGLGSLKVEGRMKAPDYVWSVVTAYRGALDDLAAGRTPTEAEEARRRDLLHRAFNRDFTSAYLYHRSDDEMMSYDRSNNRGELVGEVIAARNLGSYRRVRGGSDGGRVRTRVYTQADVTVRLTRPVGGNDLLELRPIEDPSQFITANAPQAAQAGETIVVRCVRTVPVGSPVRVIRSQAALDASAAAARPASAPKRPVSVRIEAHLGQPLAVSLACADGSHAVRAEGFVVEPARTKAVTREDLAEHVCRMGGTPFDPVDVRVDLDDGCGMGFSAVHKVRAQACKLLEEDILAAYLERESLGEKDLGALASQSPSAGRASGRACLSGEAASRAACSAQARARVASVPRGPSRPGADALEACALVPTPEVARAALAAGATRVYARDDALADPAFGGWPEGVIPWLDEVCRSCDHGRIDGLVTKGAAVGVGNVSELALAAKVGAQPEVRPCIPVHNRWALGWLERQGAAGVWLSAELTLDEICTLAPLAGVPVGLVVLGRTRAMTSEHCVLQTADRCIHDCARCGLRQRRLSLRDRDGALLPVRTDLQGRSRIYAAHPLDATPQIDRLAASGVTRFMADCTLQDERETGFAVERLVRAIAAVRAGRKPAARLAGNSSGHLFDPIE